MPEPVPNQVVVNRKLIVTGLFLTGFLLPFDHDYDNDNDDTR